MLNTAKGATMAPPETEDSTGVRETDAEQITRLRDNVTHLAEQLVQRTAEMVELRNSSAEKSCVIRDQVKVVGELCDKNLDLQLSVTVWQALSVLAFIAGMVFNTYFGA